MQQPNKLSFFRHLAVPNIAKCNTASIQEHNYWVCFLYLFLMTIVYLCQHCLNEAFSAFILYGLLSVFYTIERWGISYFQICGVTSWSAVYFRNRFYFLVCWPNIDLKTSKSINLLVEVIRKQGFGGKNLIHFEFTALE